MISSSDLKLFILIETAQAILISDGNTQFLITYCLSVFSASFGLAKCLKTGVAGTFQHGGVLDGLCSAQFLLAFLGTGGNLILINVLSGIKRLEMEGEIRKKTYLTVS